MGGWSKEGYDRYNVLYQRVKKDCQELGVHPLISMSRYMKNNKFESINQKHTPVSPLVRRIVLAPYEQVNDDDEANNGKSTDRSEPT